MTVNENLIVCSTPLHMLIAEKIINLYPNDLFDLLVVTDTLNKKYEFYIDRLANRCRNLVVFKMDSSSTFNYIKNFLDFKKRLKEIKLDYAKYFVVNITSRYVQYLISIKGGVGIYIHLMMGWLIFINMVLCIMKVNLLL